MRSDRNGFTLVELVMVIAIIGILASLSVPKFLDLSAAAKASATKAGLGSIRSVLAIRYAQSATGGVAATFPGSLAASDFAGDPPKNVVIAAAPTSIIGLVATVNGTTTHATGGFWYVSGPTSSADYGKAGAYSDGTVNTSGY
jgi:prepilin-type N-terminal cleavage/methylation domain-containing protein